MSCRLRQFDSSATIGAVLMSVASTMASSKKKSARRARKSAKVEQAAEELLQRIARHVRKCRAEYDWSKQELAERSGLPRSAIDGIEKGKRNFTMTLFAQLAVGLARDPSELVQPHTRPLPPERR